MWRNKRRRKKGRRVIEIDTSAEADRGGGLGLDSCQPSDEDPWKFERLFIVCVGVRKTAQLFATGCLPRP